MAKNTSVKKKASSKKRTPQSKKRSPARKKSRAKRRSGKRISKKEALKKVQQKRNIVVFVSVLIIAAIIAAAAAVKNTDEKKEFKQLSEDVSWGIDVSSHNGKIDWKRVADNADFAFIRVGYRGYSKGELNADENAQANLRGAKRHNVPTGAYIYSQATNEKEAEEEAEFLLKKVKGYNVTLPLVIDFEYASRGGKLTGRLYNAKLNKNKTAGIINAFCSKIRKAGYTPGVYASTYIYESRMNTKKLSDDIFIWVADYNKNITYKGYYDIWQYSEKSRCDGISSKYVDANYFYTKKRL